MGNFEGIGNFGIALPTTSAIIKSAMQPKVTEEAKVA